jgi:predicted RNase H-like HicB family nuclease
VELTVVVREEGESYWSEVKELPGCFASGGTLTELAEALGEAIGFCLGDQPAELDHSPIVVGEQKVSVQEA